MISFIICTYNRDKYIYECLSRLAQNSCQSGWEIILVNNNSTDQTAAECQRFVQDYAAVSYHYFVETEQGLSFARNCGIKEAKGDWLVFLDDDAMVEKDYIANLQQDLKGYPHAQAFGGPIEPFFEGETPKWLSPWTMGFVSAIDLGREVVPFAANKYPIGANMGISRRAIEQVGVFNISLGRVGNSLLGGEEKDIFNRLHEKHLPILYFPNIKVKHCIPPRRTTNEFIAKLGYGVGQSEKLRTQALGRMAYMKRLGSELIKWCATMVLLVLYTLCLQPAKGTILVRFRYNVTKGLL